jgi:hypothetical protein
MAEACPAKDSTTTSQVALEEATSEEETQDLEGNRIHLVDLQVALAAQVQEVLVLLNPVALEEVSAEVIQEVSVVEILVASVEVTQEASEEVSQEASVVGILVASVEVTTIHSVVDLEVEIKVFSKQRLKVWVLIQEVDQMHLRITKTNQRK